MGLLQRWFSTRSRTRIRERANDSPSIHLYAEHTRSAVASNNLAEAERIVNEGLDIFPSSTELDRLRRLVRQQKLADRVREIRKRLDRHPTPALYHELLDIQLLCNDTAAAEVTCSEWRRMFPIDAGAELGNIRIALARFYKDRAAADGRAAISGLEKLLARDPGHARALRLMAELCSRIGSLTKARDVLSRLSQIVPDDPEVGGWREKVDQAIRGGPANFDLNRILREVEETGQFPDPVPTLDDEKANKKEKEEKKPRILDSARPALAKLSKLQGVRLVTLVRGSAALVRGAPTGGAEPVARSTRAVAIHAKRTTRRMGLGTFKEAVIESDNGSLVICCGDPSSASAIVEIASSIGAVRAALEDLASAPAPDHSNVPEGAEGELVHA
ncbi:MAG: tetratricopeptide repeat protein [Planctomycetes bacterium]|nr:tetratricopeptide repeat protein [Planctomycetota bacterium]